MNATAYTFIPVTIGLQTTIDTIALTTSIVPSYRSVPRLLEKAPDEFRLSMKAVTCDRRFYMKGSNVRPDDESVGY
ncbi:hypothetical protein J6590_027731 [Homalodisca vitripennis]|nr:hypothetical protein J6590_027731 [Homalodisca vitripennis]